VVPSALPRILGDIEEKEWNELINQQWKMPPGEHEPKRSERRHLHAMRNHGKPAVGHWHHTTRSTSGTVNVDITDQDRASLPNAMNIEDGATRMMTVRAHQPVSTTSL